MKIFAGVILILLILLTPFISRVFKARKEGRILLGLFNMVKSNEDILTEIGTLQTTGLNTYPLNLDQSSAEMNMEFIGDLTTIHIIVDFSRIKTYCCGLSKNLS